MEIAQWINAPILSSLSHCKTYLDVGFLHCIIIPERSLSRRGWCQLQQLICVIQHEWSRLKNSPWLWKCRRCTTKQLNCWVRGHSSSFSFERKVNVSQETCGTPFYLICGSQPLNDKYGTQEFHGDHNNGGTRRKKTWWYPQYGPDANPMFASCHQYARCQG